MGLTGLQIFKLLPNTNCRKCGQPDVPGVCHEAGGRQGIARQVPGRLGRGQGGPRRRVGAAHSRRHHRQRDRAPSRWARRRSSSATRRPSCDSPGSSAASMPRGLSAAELDERIGGGRASSSNGPARVSRSTASRSWKRPASRPARLRQRPWPSAALPVALLRRDARGGERDPRRDQGRSARSWCRPSGADLAPFVAVAAKARPAPGRLGGGSRRRSPRPPCPRPRPGVTELLLEPPGKNLPELHQNLSLIRRGALDRVHPGLGLSDLPPRGGG